MKLFLASEGIQSALKDSFIELVNKPPQDIRFALITNAADPYPPEKRGFVATVRQQIQASGITPQDFNLDGNGRIDEIYEALMVYDVIWCGGGNAWYLR